MSVKGRKSSPVWDYFAPLDPTFHPSSKNLMVCLVCRDDAIDKTISLGKDGSMSPTGLVNHLRQHAEEYQQYLEKKEEVKDAGPKQTSINSFLASTCTTKELFKRKYTKWIIDQTMPFEVGSSESFRDMVNCLNKTVSVPDRKELLGILDVKKRQTVEFLKTMLTDTYFSITTDHWTSLAVDNYGAFTIHFIHNFELKSYVLSCSKHEGEATAPKLERQLYNALTDWGLSTMFCVAVVSDSASNMNALGERIMASTSISHHYCSDHILQLTAAKAFSGSADTMAAVKKLKSLVTFVNKSPQTSAKLANCQKKSILLLEP